MQTTPTALFMEVQQYLSIHQFFSTHSNHIFKHIPFKLHSITHLLQEHQYTALQGIPSPLYNLNYSLSPWTIILSYYLNAKQIQWGCHSNSPCGNSLHQITYSKNYNILSPSSPTYVNLIKKTPRYFGHFYQQNTKQTQLFN